MIRILAATEQDKILKDITLDQLQNSNIKWFWVDFESPSEEEERLLSDYFHFHPLSIEDCLHYLQRPKLDYYEGYDFYVLHTIDQETLQPIEIDLFVSKEFIVSFHYNKSPEIDTILNDGFEEKKLLNKGILYIFYLILDKIVDHYFPTAYKLEDMVNDIEAKAGSQNLMRHIFEIRNQLLKLRRTIAPMNELIYRILNSERVQIPKEERFYFMDIYDHLQKILEIINSNREITNDIRDSYITINSYRMNNIMKTLTVLTSIFIPLTFIASIYGMNFKYMPELYWPWGYYSVLGVMVIVGSTMIFFLWRKGWFK